MNENLLAFLFLLFVFSPVIYQTIVVIREHKKERRVALKRFKRFLKYSLIVFVTTGSIVSLLSHTNYLNYQSPMPYNQLEEISFENFRGIELFKKSLYGNKRFAYVVTSIEVDFDENNVTAQTFFHPSRSFVYDQHSDSEELLTHEKYHIKITEIYARKMRKEISQMKQFSKEKVLNTVKRFNREEQEFQKQYDFDTFHSYVYSQQKRYERKVDSLLSLLSDFEKPTIIIHEKDESFFPSYPDDGRNKL